jgi:hypothetical protein
MIMALRLVAQGLDVEHGTDRHSTALAAGLTAIKEAEDFVPTAGQFEADLDVADVIRGHRTPVLKGAYVAGLAPVSVMKCYFTYAQEQLASAAGTEIAGSMALRGLGKLYAALADSAGDGQAAATRAVVFYQAALLVCQQNHLAANDLGVLLARCGNYHEALVMLQHSLAICPEDVTWHNLSVVYRQLGRSDWAQRARSQSEAVRRARPARRRRASQGTPGSLQWVDPHTFARTGAANISAASQGRASPPRRGNAADPTHRAANRPVTRPATTVEYAPQAAAKMPAPAANGPRAGWNSLWEYLSIKRK